MTDSATPQEPKPSHFQKYYQANRERLLLLQRERRNRLRDSPEWKLQRQVYNQRHREKNDTSVYMREYYSKNKEHITTLRKKTNATKQVSDEVKEQRRCRRKELRDKKQAISAGSEPRPQVPRGRPKTLFTVKLTKEALGDDASLRDALRELLRERFETSDSVNIAVSAPTEVVVT